MSVSTSDFPIDPFDSYSYPLESEEKKIHMLLSGMGVMGRFTRPLPDITPTRLRPSDNEVRITGWGKNGA